MSSFVTERLRRYCDERRASELEGAAWTRVCSEVGGATAGRLGEVDKATA